MEFRPKRDVDVPRERKIERYEEPTVRSNGHSYDTKYEGKFFSKLAVNFRKSPEYDPNNVIKVLPKNTAVTCLGEYKIVNGSTWLHVLYNSTFGYVAAEHFTK